MHEDLLETASIGSRSLLIRDTDHPRLLLRLLPRNISILRAIIFIPNQHDCYILDCLLLELPEPIVDRLEALATGDIEDHECAQGLLDMAEEPKVYLVVIDLNFYCPAVSQICTLTVWLELTPMVLVEYSSPTVGPLVASRLMPLT